MAESAKTRLYCPSLAPGLLELPGSEAHHAARVLRLSAGAAVELFDGCGRYARAEVRDVARSHVTVDVGEVAEDPAIRPGVHLGFAVPKGKRLDWLLEKATELAAASLQPVIFARSVAGGESLSNAKRERWMGHCISAAKQCGLNVLPELRPARPLEDVLADGQGDMLRLLGDTADHAPALREVLDRATAGGEGEILLLIGPEGGLTDEERDACLEAGIHPIRLGQTTLRIETAAVALLSAVRALREA